MLVAAIMAALGLAFIAVYGDLLGAPLLDLWHHFAILLPLIVLTYGLAGCIATFIPGRRTRGISTWLLSLVVVVLQVGFYILCIACLFGFRDLPTRRLVSGYYDQMVSLLGVLPVSRGLLISAAVLILVILALLAAGYAYSLQSSVAKINSRRGPAFRFTWVRLVVLSAAALAFMQSSVMAHRLSLAREPVTASIHDRPLSDSSLSAQLNPVEAAADQRIEASYPKEPLGNRRHVILIYVDALRADVLQSYGGIGEMPFMTHLVQSGTIQQFDNAFASCSMTLCGLASILQSRPAHRVTVGNFSLPKLLKRQGYDLRYLLSGDHQSFLGLMDYYGPNIDFYMDGKDIDRRYSTDDLLLLRYLDRLPAATQTSAPQFIMLGLQSTHIWGARHDEFRKLKPDQIVTHSFLDLDRNSALAYRNHYLNGVRQADYVLQAMWEWLDRSGYLKDSIVMITSDHGESLGENGTLGHARSLSTSQLLVPLWIYAPGADWPASPYAFHTDFAPTILDWLDLPQPESWTGQSLLEPRVRGAQLPLFFINRNDLFGMIVDTGTGLHKFEYDRGENRTSLFDLTADKTDSHDIAAQMTAADHAAMQNNFAREFGPMALR